MSAPVDAMAPPLVGSGTMINEFHRNTHGIIDVSVQSFLLAICYGSFALRLWSRKLQRAQLQINDWLIIAAMPVMTARYIVEVTLVLKCGVGFHLVDVMAVTGQGIITPILMFIYIMDLMWVTLVTLIKLSILHFYLMIFRQPTFMRATYVMMGVCIAFWIGGFFSTAFLCNPPRKSWNPQMEGDCGNSPALYAACALGDLIVDVIIILLPMPVLWSLQLPKAKKIALTFVFGLGFVIIAITAIRIKFMLVLNPMDVTWSGKEMAVLSAIVPLLGIVNANLPVMAPAFNKIFRTSAMASAFKKSLKSGSSGTNRSKGNFEILTEPELPLVQIKGPGAPPRSHFPSHQKNKVSHVDKIQITTEWEVRSHNTQNRRY